MPTLPSQTTPYYGGGQVQNPANVIQTSGSPSTKLLDQGLGTLAVDNASGAVYCLSSKLNGMANWSSLAAAGVTYPISPFVVGPVGKAGYQTIQSAINSAESAGGGTVYVQPGTYTENLAFTTGTVTVCGAVSLGDIGQCEIIGVHTPPPSGSIVLRNFKLSSPTHIFSSNVAGTSHLIIIDALLNVTNGYTFNCPNWTGAGVFELFDINNSGTNDGGVNNTGGASFFCFEAGIGNGTSNTMTISGTTVFDGANVGCPVNLVTGGNLSSSNVNYSHTVTFSNNSSGSCIHDNFSTGSTPSVVQSSSGSVSISQCVINSSNNPSIDGSGSGMLSLGDISFLSNSVIAGTLTLAWAETKTGKLTSTGIQVKSGANTRIGVGSALVGGTLAVANTSVTANTVVMVSITSLGTVTSPKAVYVTKNSGVGFTVTSADATDTSTFDWYLVEAV